MCTTGRRTTCCSFHCPGLCSYYSHFDYSSSCFAHRQTACSWAPFSVAGREAVETGRTHWRTRWGLYGEDSTMKTFRCLAELFGLASWWPAYNPATFAAAELNGGPTHRLTFWIFDPKELEVGKFHHSGLDIVPDRWTLHRTLQWIEFTGLSSGLSTREYIEPYRTSTRPYRWLQVNRTREKCWVHWADTTKEKWNLVE